MAVMQTDSPGPVVGPQRRNQPAVSVVRSRAMLLMYEELARARMRELQEEARDSARARHLLAARRWQRRAESAARRARLARESVR